MDYKLMGIVFYICLPLLSWAMAMVPEEQFFPFGTSNGDAVVPRNDDASSGMITVNVAFPFFGIPRSKLWVNTNGVLSFGAEINQFTPSRFPLTTSYSMVAPYWADVDTRYNWGRVYYRETTDSNMLNRASLEAVRHFPELARFQALWAFVATWQNVTCYGCTSTKPENTFQAVLATDGTNSFAYYYYNKVSWTTGLVSGNTRAEVGFDAGNGRAYYTVPDSMTPAIVNIPSTSNVGEPGKWIFRIDTATITGGQTAAPSTLQPTTVAVCTPCSDHGTFTCTCDRGYTGTHCEQEIDWCSIILTDTSSPTNMSELCQTHGQCRSTPQGAYCVCDHGFTGRFCENEVANEIWLGDRCALRNTTLVLQHNITVGCPKGTPDQPQHCLPDDLDCFFSNCSEPVGWCLPTNSDSYARLAEKLLQIYN